MREAVLARLNARLLGGFSLRDGDGRVVHVPGRKTQALFAYLALNPDRYHSREKLAGLLWGEHGEAQARQSLRKSIFVLRKALGPAAIDVLSANGDGLAFHAAETEVDALALQRGDRDAGDIVAGLGEGVFLDGLDVPAPGFEAWLLRERTRLHDAASDALLKLAEELSQRGDVAGAIQAAQRLVEKDPLREEAHRLLMRLLLRDGRRAEAVRQYDACVQVLRKELGIEPAAETRSLYAEIKTRPAPAPGDRTRPAIAVLPFDNLSDDADQQHFADGMAEDLITILSRFRWFDVIARTSSFAYRGQAIDARQLARVLGVQYLIEGSVRRSDNRLRVTVQLIDGATGNHVWAERYDRGIDDIFDVQEEIAQTIAGRLEPELAESERARSNRKAPHNMDAWDFYQRGLSRYYQISRESNADARQLFQRAIDADPGFSPAYARLAVVHQNDAFFGYVEDRSVILDTALALARRAVSLDGRDALSHYALGRVHSRREEFEPAIKVLRTAIDLNPSFAEAYFGLGVALYYAGEQAEAIRHANQAVRLSPNAPNLFAFHHLRARCHLDLRQYEQALEYAGRAIRQPNAHVIALAVYAAAAIKVGKQDSACAAIGDLLRREPDFTVDHVRARYGSDNIQEPLKRFADALRRAGLPD